VSHRIRKEKICLNCGTETPGHYCPSCGQKNIEPKQSIWHIIGHAFSDITHWDGKFFTTVKELFAKPGFLSNEYMIGRRMRYLDPIRMYIFTSAIFFLIFFSYVDVKHLILGNETTKAIKSDSDYKELAQEMKAKKDSLKNLGIPLNKRKPVIQIYSDSVQKAKAGDLNINVASSEFDTPGAYDSAQKLKPASERDGWFTRRMNMKAIQLNQRYKNEHSTLVRDMLENFMHNSPKLLFISLPLFALLLKLLYLRRKNFYYVDHIIFAVHLYIFTFLILLVYFGLKELKLVTGWGLINWLIAALLIYPFVYYYKAMRRFYAQKRGKTILKYILLFIMSGFIQLFIFVLGILFTVYET
jgi:hypothetical protein